MMMTMATGSSCKSVTVMVWPWLPLCGCLTLLVLLITFAAVGDAAGVIAVMIIGIGAVSVSIWSGKRQARNRALMARQSAIEVRADLTNRSKFILSEGHRLTALRQTQIAQYQQMLAQRPEMDRINQREQMATAALQRDIANITVARKTAQEFMKKLTVARRVLLARNRQRRDELQQLTTAQMKRGIDGNGDGVGVGVGIGVGISAVVDRDGDGDGNPAAIDNGAGRACDSAATASVRGVETMKVDAGPISRMSHEATSSVMTTSTTKTVSPPMRPPRPFIIPSPVDRSSSPMPISPHT